MAKKTAAEKTVKIKLLRSMDEKEQSVFVSVNDRTFQIKRGVEVEVPECVAEVLENSRRMEEEAEDFICSVIEK